MGDLEKAVDDWVDGEVGAEFLLVEVVADLALFFGPVAGFPRFEGADGFAGGGGFEVAQLTGFLLEGVFDADMKVFDETEGGGAGTDHAPGGDEVWEMVLADEVGELAAQFEDARDEGAVVVGLPAAEPVEGFPDLAAQGVAVGIGQHGDE